MTTQKSFKRRIRERMDKTGGSYTAARRQLLPNDAPSVLTPEQRVLLMRGEDVVIRATGHGWDHWVALLDDWDAPGRTHAEIARHLVEAHQVSGWWAQGITVSYERVRGMRKVGETSDGFMATASRTVIGEVGAIHTFLSDADIVADWLVGLPVRPRPSRARRMVPLVWDDGAEQSRVDIGLTAKTADARGRPKAVIAISHHTLPSEHLIAERKALWKERLTALPAQF